MIQLSILVSFRFKDRVPSKSTVVRSPEDPGKSGNRGPLPDLGCPILTLCLRAVARECPGIDFFWQLGQFLVGFAFLLERLFENTRGCVFPHTGYVE